MTTTEFEKKENKVFEPFSIIVNNIKIICSGKAIDIIDSLKELKTNNIEFEISPTFNYEI